MDRLTFVTIAALTLAACEDALRPDAESPSPGTQSQAALLAAAPRAYVANGQSSTVSVIDTESNLVVATIPVGDIPLGVAITPDGGFAYISKQAPWATPACPTPPCGSVSVVETVTNTVVATIALGGTPLGVAITPDGAFAYVTSGSEGVVHVISTATNTVVETIDVGFAPTDVEITPDGSLAYVTHGGSQELSVISTATRTIVETVEVGPAPLGLDITPDGSFMYITLNSGPGGVDVVSTATNAVVATVATRLAADVAITPDGDFVYATINAIPGHVAVIATATNVVVSTIAVPVNVRRVAIAPDGAFAYVTHQPPSGGNGTVFVISTTTNTVVQTIGVGAGPRGIAITPAVERRRGQEKVEMCHRNREIVIARSAVAGHLRHGDTIGRCS